MRHVGKGMVVGVKKKTAYYTIEFDENTGKCLWLSFPEEGEGTVLKKNELLFDVRVDGRLLFKEDNIKTVSSGEDESGFHFLYEISGLKIAYEVTFSNEQPVIRQGVTVSCIKGSKRRLLEVHYKLPEFLAGHKEDCRVWIPGNPIKPEILYEEIAKVSLDREESEPLPFYPSGWLEQCPDQSNGLITIENKARGQYVSAWFYSEKSPAFPVIEGKDGYLYGEYHHQTAMWLKGGASFESKEMNLLLTEGTLEEHLESYRSEYYKKGARTIPVREKEWLKNARLLQINPRPVKLWTKRLEEIEELGFNLLYLLPVWENTGNPYSMVDHYIIDGKKDTEPESLDSIRESEWNQGHYSVGSEEELKEFIHKAHKLGMRVIFDLIPQGIWSESPFVKAHEEWLVKDEFDRTGCSHGWGPRAGEPTADGTYSMDWGNPDYRKFALDWAVYHVKKYDIDGYRTDAMHWKEPNWGSGNPREAWETCYGGVLLAEELRRALDEIKPEAVLIGEVWGPIFNSGHDATYENGWMLKYVNEGWLTGKAALKGYQWQQHLKRLEDIRSEGIKKMLFTCNHDSAELAELARNRRTAEAVSFLHMFSNGLPFIWWGELRGREEFFRNLLRERKNLEGYRSILDLAPSSAELFTALFVQEGREPVLAVSNPSLYSVHAEIPLNFPVKKLTLLIDRLETAESEQTCIKIKVKSGGYGLIRLT